MSQTAKANGSESAEFSKARILHAALKEFGLHGYRGARIDAVARRAGVPRGLIAYYFGTKEGLFRAVGDQRAASMQRIQQQLRHGRDDPFVWTLAVFGNELTLDWVRLLIWEALDWEPRAN